MNIEQAWLFDNGAWSRIENKILQYWKTRLEGMERTREEAISLMGYSLDSKAVGYASPVSFSFYPSMGNSVFYGYMEVCIEGSTQQTLEGIFVTDLPSLLQLRNLLAPGIRSNVQTFISRE